jgi:hypothetical protein
MANAKQELLKEVEGKTVVCVEFQHGDKTFVGTLEEALPLLDFNYDDGFGGQELYGYIWYDDGTWSERSEYDGSEWWSYKKRKEVPKCST